MYEIWNASFCHDDKNKVAIVQCCLIQLLKEPLVLSFFCRVFPYVHFEGFGELKMRYLQIDPFNMNIINIFDVRKIIIEM